MQPMQAPGASTTVTDSDVIIGMLSSLWKHLRLLISILHVMEERERPYTLIAQLRDAIPPGRHLVLNHVEDHPGMVGVCPLPGHRPRYLR